MSVHESPQAVERYMFLPLPIIMMRQGLRLMVHVLTLAARKL